MLVDDVTSAHEDKRGTECVCVGGVCVWGEGEGEGGEGMWVRCVCVWVAGWVVGWRGGWVNG